MVSNNYVELVRKDLSNSVGYTPNEQFYAESTNYAAELQKSLSNSIDEISKDIKYSISCLKSTDENTVSATVVEYIDTLPESLKRDIVTSCYRAVDYVREVLADRLNRNTELKCILASDLDDVTEENKGALSDYVNSKAFESDVKQFNNK